MGPDGVHGSVYVGKSDEAKARRQQLAEFMNKAETPQYIKASRLTVLSKTGRPEVECKDTRPLCVNSHSLKIMEKLLKRYLDGTNSALTRTSRW